ncbi:hypothetical protein NKG94_23670 [Micromonospora sp. M12]
MLLLALAVGGSTLAWSLISTGSGPRSSRPGTRSAPTCGSPNGRSRPVDRAGQLAALPSVHRVLPRRGRDPGRAGGTAGDRHRCRPGQCTRRRPTRRPAQRRAAGGAVPADDRCAWGPAGVELPAEARAITGTVRTPVSEAAREVRVAVTLLVASSDGLALRLPAVDADGDGRATRFTVRLPDLGGRGCGWSGSKPTAGWRPATPTDSRWTA